MAETKISNTIKQALVIALIGGGGISAGGFSVMHLSGPDQKVADQFTAIQKEIDDLKNLKADNDDVKSLEGILIIINYDVCMLRAGGGQEGEARCETTRNERLSDLTHR